VSDYQTIRYQRQDDVGTLTLARPGKRNAQNPLMWQELAKLGADLLPDETLRCLVVTGEGPSFSAGIDLVEGIGGVVAGWAERLADERTLAEGTAAAKTFSWIPNLGCASIAAVQGHAYGAEGTKVGLPETRYGLLPDMGATVRLPRIVGESRARELILLGSIIDAGEALRIGLANRVVASEDLDEAAAEFARRLAAQPPLAVRGARRAIDAAWHCSPDESFRTAIEAQIRCIGSEDFIEARHAMAEGRAPHWRGR